MPKKIQKSLQACLSKIKNPHPQILRFNSFSFSKNWILSRSCIFPNTGPVAVDGRNESPGEFQVTLADIDRFLLENFKSLYVKDDEETDNNDNNTKRVSEEESHDKAPKLGPISFDSPSNRFMKPPLDLCGSNRFFVNRVFSSGLLVEDALTSMTTTGDEAGSTSTSTSTTTLNDSSSSSFNDLHHQNCHARAADQDQTLPDNSVAVLTYSRSPYEEFRRSMQGMVEGRLRNGERVDWEFMEELLFCYIDLNDKKSYKFILSAFVDLISVMRPVSETVPAKPRSVRTVRIGRQLIMRKKMNEVTLEFGSP